MASPTPARPLVLYDGACGFCKLWVDYGRHVTGDAVDYAPSAERGHEFPQISPAAFDASVQLVLPNSEVLSGAHAVFSALASAPHRGTPLRLYQASTAFAAVSEAVYRWVAGHRNFSYRATVLAIGRRVEPLSYQRTQWLFLRLLGLIYLLAFFSLATQLRGLIGAAGITPAWFYLQAARQALGLSAYARVPTVFWFGSSDAALTGVCYAGILLSLMLLGGLSWRPVLAALYLLYLSFSSVGQEFLSFQWDALLVETGFLALFLGRSRLPVLMFRWLLFRLMFLSGAVKLLSHDPSWRSLTALNFHYFTQPLPTPVAWYLQQAPPWFQTISTLFVFVVELGLPVLIFFPRRIRRLAAAGFITLQLLIALSGNYAFFNLLALSLCLFLFDDRALFGPRAAAPPAAPSPLAVRAAAAVLLSLGLALMAGTFFNFRPVLIESGVQTLAPFEIVNPYGLFAVMTTRRLEIVVQGSDDGVNWKDYRFRYKPGDPLRRPAWVAPHQPRLDWQMWFAALGDYRGSPWFVALLRRLLQGSPPVLALFESNPFPVAPPRYVRALAYEYRFTNWAQRRSTGAWWAREPRGYYLPPISLDSFRRPGN